MPPWVGVGDMQELTIWFLPARPSTPLPGGLFSAIHAFRLPAGTVDMAGRGIVPKPIELLICPSSGLARGG